jgi:predicted nuclease of restriction endonuclease-like RecB superfamily
MLTREHAVAAYKDGRVLPDRLTRGRHAAYLGHAAAMLDLYREGLGRTRRDLHRDVQAIFREEADCPSRRIEAFCKLLDDASVFDTDTSGRAAELRRKVFRLAAPYHPLVRESDKLFEHEEAAVKARIAKALGLPWEAIERDLFADVPEFHRLREFEGFEGPEALLSRYNVAQVQVALFRATEMTVRAQGDFKTILRYAKLARLMHTIRRAGEGYEFRFDGPASVLRETRRYGTAMAAFLPALLACSGWRMSAMVQPPWSGPPNRLEISPADGLKGHLPPPEAFDSSVEEAFARKWGEGRREGWALLREGGVLSLGQKAFIPDFLFRHEDGREVLLEVVGFWTPEYLRAKAETLRAFRDRHVLLAVAEAVEAGMPELPEGAIRFKTALKLEPVLSSLARMGEIVHPV